VYNSIAQVGIISRSMITYSRVNLKYAELTIFIRKYEKKKEKTVTRISKAANKPLIFFLFLITLVIFSNLISCYKNNMLLLNFTVLLREI